MTGSFSIGEGITLTNPCLIYYFTRDCKIGLAVCIWGSTLVDPSKCRWKIISKRFFSLLNMNIHFLGHYSLNNTVWWLHIDITSALQYVSWVASAMIWNTWEECIRHTQIPHHFIQRTRAASGVMSVGLAGVGINFPWILRVTVF